MARTVNHIERMSESFDSLDSMSQSDIICELFARMTDTAKSEAYRRMTNHAKMNGLVRPEARQRRDADVGKGLIDATIEAVRTEWNRE